MAEQCIVCLDPLLQAAESTPPAPADSASAASNCDANATTSTITRYSGPFTTTKPEATTTAAATASTEPEGTVANNGQLSDAGDNDNNSNSNHLSAAAVEFPSHDDDNVAVIQICGHSLHDVCLREWSTKANSCPICRQSFHLVHVYDKIGGTLLSSYKVEDKKQVAEFDPQAWLDEYPDAEDEDVSTPCPVCNLADHEEVLLLCDGCDTPYHTHCIGLDSVPQGAWFCMECVDIFGTPEDEDDEQGAVRAAPSSPRTSAAAATAAAIVSSADRRGGPRGSGNSPRRAARAFFFPRTRHTMRRARRRAASDEWQGAWGQITGRVWDVLNIDLDHDDDEALEEYRRVERLRDNERREFQRWQERLNIARRLGAQEVFEQNIPTALMHRASRRLALAQSQGQAQGRHSQAENASGAQPSTSAFAAAVREESREERRAWGAFERARECDSVNVPQPNGRKRKSRSVTASPSEPAQEPERKLKRPRTRRIGAPNEGASSSSAAKSPSLLPMQNRPDRIVPMRTRSPPDAVAGSLGSASGSASGSAPGSASGSASGFASGSRPGLSLNSSSGPASNPTTTASSSRSPASGDEPRSFLSSLLKEVEMSTPSDDENIRSLFADSRVAPPGDPLSPAGSSPSASGYNSPRALSTTPPPHRALRPSSPTLLSSHIEPIYPPANYSPTRGAATGSSGSGNGSGSGGLSGGDTSDSENAANSTGHGQNSSTNHHRPSNAALSSSPPAPAAELRQPRPQRRPNLPLTRSPDVSPSRAVLPLEMKQSISGIVRTALSPHWKSSQLTADQYAVINRDVSRKLYEEVTAPLAAIDAEARRLWEQKATREVARAVAQLQS